MFEVNPRNTSEGEIAKPILSLPAAFYPSPSLSPSSTKAAHLEHRCHFHGKGKTLEEGSPDRKGLYRRLENGTHLLNLFPFFGFHYRLNAHNTLQGILSSSPSPTFMASDFMALSPDEKDCEIFFGLRRLQSEKIYRQFCKGQWFRHKSLYNRPPNRCYSAGFNMKKLEFKSMKDQVQSLAEQRYFSMFP